MLKLHVMINLIFVKMMLKLSYMFFVCVKKLYLFGGISACIYMYIEQPKKDLVLMSLILSWEKYH